MSLKSIKNSKNRVKHDMVSKPLCDFAVPICGIPGEFDVLSDFGGLDVL